MQDDLSQRSDGALLAEQERFDEAFAVFYRRHVEAVLRFCARRGLRAEEAADLTAETFVTALRARGRYRPELGDARGWLLGIAKHKMADQARRWSREQRLRQRLELEPIALSDQDLADFAALADDEVDGAALAFAALPPGQRAAVNARVVEDQDYTAIGRDLGLTEAGARQRVSRGLAALRIRLKEQR